MKYDLTSAIKIVNRFSIDPKQLSATQTDLLLSGVGHEMQLEPVSLEDVENTYLETALVEDDLLLSAIITKRNRLDRTMRAFVKALNGSLVGTGLTAGADLSAGEESSGQSQLGNAFVSKPRKAGQYAVITAQIPVSDGQSISIVFYAPDDDPLKIAENDTLIAFRFLLNKRDITHIVAPANGKDISLRQTTVYISNALEMNSEKFKANQEKANGEKARLAELESELSSTVDEANKAADTIEEVTADSASTKEEVEVLIEKIDRLKASNALLEDAIKKAKAGGEPAAKSAAEQQLIDLLEGRITPKSIVGSGYRNPKQLASGNLRRDIYNASHSDKIDGARVKANGEAFATHDTAKSSTLFKKLSRGENPLAEPDEVVKEFGVTPTYGGFMVYIRTQKATDEQSQRNRDDKAAAAAAAAAAASDAALKIEMGGKVFGGDNFWYGLRARPVGIGAVPAGAAVTLSNEEAKTVFTNLSDSNSIRHGAIAYTKELSKQQVSGFELIPLNKEAGEELGATAAFEKWEDLFPKGIQAVIQKAIDSGFTLSFEPQDEDYGGKPTAYVSDNKTSEMLDLSEKDDRLKLADMAKQWNAAQQSAEIDPTLTNHLATLKKIAGNELSLEEATKELEIIGDYIEEKDLESAYEAELTEAIEAVTVMIQDKLATAKAA